MHILPVWRVGAFSSVSALDYPCIFNTLQSVTLLGLTAKLVLMAHIILAERQHVNKDIIFCDHCSKLVYLQEHSKHHSYDQLQMGKTLERL